MIRAAVLAAALAGSVADAQQSCFTRTYSDAHLLTQPQQTVKEMQVVFSGSATGPGRLGEFASVAVRFRGETTQWTSGLVCFDATRCGVECDGGTFTVRWKGADTILLTTGGFIVGLGCDGENTDEDTRMVIDRGAQETTYLLRRTPVRNCPSEFFQ